MHNIELPIVAIIISGEDAVIRLTIDEVFGYPGHTSYTGGYDVKGTLKIQAGKYSVIDAVNFFQQVNYMNLEYSYSNAMILYLEKHA